MNVREINHALSLGSLSQPGLFPHLEALQKAPFVFEIAFGLKELPPEPGLLIIRGARQYGKSTWLEMQMRRTVEEFGPGSAYYLNGDILSDAKALNESILELLPLFATDSPVRRLFIDEITSVPNWQKSLKYLLDSGELRRVLIVSTGSKAADLRHGAERLPGRKGKLARTDYYFTPISYREFMRVCGPTLGPDALEAYLLSGGSPVALGELAREKLLPDFIIQMTKDWIYGEFAASGRSRANLLAVLDILHTKGGAPLGQAKLAREAGLSNNTVAAGYTDLLGDLLCVATSFPWDASRRRAVFRKPCKYHFNNLLVAATWKDTGIRSVDEFRHLPGETQGCWWEWLVAQELWRRAAIRGEETPELMGFWQSKEHELDFVLSPTRFLEVKRGQATPVEFSWFPKIFPKSDLTVICKTPFQTPFIRGITMENFLLDDGE